MKKFVLALGVFAAVFAAKADGLYLYWMIDMDAKSIEQYKNFSYATVSSKSGDILYSYSGDPTETEGEQYIGAAGSGETGTKTVALWAYDVSSYVGSSFIFELYKTGEEDSFASLTMSYSTLLAQGHIGSGRDKISAYVASNFAEEEPIPEPTSGLLMLLGLVGLALKRKRA